MSQKSAKQAALNYSGADKDPAPSPTGGSTLEPPAGYIYDDYDYSIVIPPSRNKRFISAVGATMLFMTFLVFANEMQKFYKTYNYHEYGPKDIEWTFPERTNGWALVMLAFIFCTLCAICKAVMYGLESWANTCKSPKVFEPIIKCMYGEVAIFVFVGICTYAFRPYGHSPCNMEFWDKLMGTVRLQLFGFVLAFIGLVLWLLLELYRVDKLWTSYENDLLIKGDNCEVMEKRVLRASMMSLYSHWTNPMDSMRMSDLLQQFQWVLIRERFITVNEFGRKRLPRDFRLSRYLMTKTVQFLADSINISPPKNILMWSIMFGYLFLSEEMWAVSYLPNLPPTCSGSMMPPACHPYRFPDMHFLAMCSVGQIFILLMCWVVLIAVMVIYYGLKNIKANLTPQHRLINPSFNKDADYLDPKQPKIFALLTPPYMSKAKMNSKANRHQQLFTALGCIPLSASNARGAYVLFIQSCLLLIPILCVQLYMGAINGMNTWAMIYAMVPLFVTVFSYVPGIVKEIGIVLHIEQCKDYAVVQEVDKLGKVDKAMSTMKVMAQLAALAGQEQKKASGKTVPMQASKEELEELQEEFDSFEKPGGLDTTDLITAFEKMGQTITEEKLTQVMKDLDIKGGKIKFEDYKRIFLKGAAKDVKSAFNFFDKDQSGAISSVELRGAMNNINSTMTEAELNTLMAVMDADGSGEISFNEFAAVMNSDYQKPSIDELAPFVFGMIDKDVSGVVTIQEFRDYFANLNSGLSKEDLDVVLSQFGIDGIGGIKQADFAKVLKAMEM